MSKHTLTGHKVDLYRKKMKKSLKGTDYPPPSICGHLTSLFCPLLPSSLFPRSSLCFSHTGLHQLPLSVFCTPGICLSTSLILEHGSPLSAPSSHIEKTSLTNLPQIAPTTPFFSIPLPCFCCFILSTHHLITSCSFVYCNESKMQNVSSMKSRAFCSLLEFSVLEHYLPYIMCSSFLCVKSQN